MWGTIRTLVGGLVTALVIAGAAATPAAAGTAWLYRDCPSGKDVTAASSRTGGTETYHAYYQNGNGPYTIVRRTSVLVLTGSDLNYSDVHFLSDGSFLSLSTGCA